MTAPTEVFVPIPMSVLIALLDAAAADAELIGFDFPLEVLRSYQALQLTLRFLGVHHPEVRDKWLAWQEKTGSEEIVSRLRAEWL